MDSRTTTDRRRAAAVLWLAVALPAVASDDSGGAAASGNLRPVVVAEGREFIVLLPPGAAPGPPAGLSAASAGFAAQSYETGARRIHVVTYDGETYRAATAKDGPRSRIVFDTGGRRFRSLLPSIRVELDGNAPIGEVAEFLGAVRVTRFDRLGFAVLDLPADLHPAEAVQRVRELPGSPKAAVRLRMPRIEWK